MIRRSCLAVALAAACTAPPDDTGETDATRSYGYRGTWSQIDFQKATLEIEPRIDGGERVTGTSVLDYTGFWALRLSVTETVDLDPDGVVERWTQEQRNLLGTTELDYRFDIDAGDGTALQGIADRAATVVWDGSEPAVTYAFPSDGFFAVAHPTPVAGYVTRKALEMGADLRIVLPWYGISETLPADDAPVSDCLTWFGDRWCYDEDGVPTTFIPASYGAPVGRVDDPDEVDLGEIQVAAPTTMVTARDCSIPGEGPRHVVYEMTSGDGTMIAGRLLLPEGDGPFPAVTTNSGIGGMDREGTVEPSAMWNCVSHDLLAEGIAVASYDDRGIGESGGEISDSYNGRTDDAVAVAAWVAARPEVGSLYLLGHSEGAAHASAAAPHLDAAGLILVAGNSGTGEEAWIEQGRVYLESLGFPEAQVTAFVAGRASIAEQLIAGSYSDDRFAGLPVDAWWAPYLVTDGRALVLATDEPVLIVQGGKDWQVPAHHGDDLLAALQGASRDVTLAEFPDLGHLFQPAIGPVPCGLEYHLPWSWDPTVTAAIADWIGGREGTR